MKTENEGVSTTRELDGLRKEALYDCVDRFDYGSELAKRVYHLGELRFTDAGSTAWIRVDPNEKVAFWFNRSFFDSLSDDELAFVLFHEVLHVAFRHHARRQDRDPKLWNLAGDLVCNAWLLERVGFRSVRTKRFGSFLSSAVTFENIRLVPPRDHLDVTAEHVYDLLEGGAVGCLRAAGSLVPCDQHTWDDAADGTEVRQDDAALEDFRGKVEKLLEEWMPGWSEDPVGDQRAVGTADSRPVNWAVLLRSRLIAVSRHTIEQRWAPGSRKIAWMYPRLLFPGDREIEMPCTSILIALDSSGSIRPDVLDRLLAIARSLPEDRFEVEAVSFDTQVYPLDLRARRPKLLGGGGTSFQAIEDFARTRRRYPDMVVVLTDGYASRPRVLRPDRWLWLLTERGTAEQVTGIGRRAWISALVSSAR